MAFGASAARATATGGSTNEAILLDTAGRWAVEADDREEWLAFLDMLKKYRSRKPINGVLVAISVTDLMQATEEQIDSYAKRLRARFDEMTTRLQMIVPVYVMFTKVDLVAGFVEFFGELSKTERAQILGVTWPLEGSQKRDPAKAFDEEFDLLVERLHARALKRIVAKRQAEVRQRVYLFPLEFAALRQGLRDFVRLLMQPNTFQETPILRGVYFSSGTQEGSPIERVIGAMRRAFNLPGSQGMAPPATEARSYFVTDIFKRVVFPDQNVASRTRREQKRQLANRIAVGLAVVGIGGALVLPSLYTFAQNMSLVSESRQLAEHTQNIDWSDKTPFVEKVHKLDALHARLEDIDGWRKDGPPLRMRWGMYAGDRVYDALRAVYVGSLQAQFSEPTRIQLERDLASITAAGRLTPEQYGGYFDRLKAYLEMAEPARIDHDWLTATLTDEWAHLLGTTSASDAAALRPHVGHYVELVQSGEASPWNIDKDLVNRVRTALNQVSEADRYYSALIGAANENTAPITRQGIFVGSTFATYLQSRTKKDVSVKGAFTRPGWETYVRDRLDPSLASKFASDRWVLGDTEESGTEHMTKMLQGLRDRYFADYRAAWADFFRDLDVRAPANNDEALAELTSMSENPAPYAKLLGVLADNTHLELPQGSALAQAAQPLVDKLTAQAQQNSLFQTIVGDAGAPPSNKRWVSPVESAFAPMVNFAVSVGGGDDAAPTGLSHYLQQIISKVIATLTDIHDEQTADPQVVDTVFRESLRSATELVAATQSGFTMPLLQPLLLNPIRRGFHGVLVGEGDDLAHTWSIKVAQTFHEKLEGHYPFVDSPQDASLVDYGDFFRPTGGLLWGFYKDHLSDTLERQGENFVPVTKPNTPIYTGDFVRCYQRGWQITTDTFPENGADPNIEFDVNVHSVSETVSEVALLIDGVSQTYRNTPEEWLHFSWPSTDPKKRGATLKVRGSNGLAEEITRPGDFGLFRLLDSASSMDPGGGKGGVTTVMWTLQSQNAWVRMDFRPTRGQQAFAAYARKKDKLFRNYTCPDGIASGVH